MLNPSYLIKSRHGIYYFRYPLPLTQCGKRGRVSISLQTRCPREALRLANFLEYHSISLIDKLDSYQMEYTELVEIFKNHFSELLKVKQITMDEFGPLPQAEIKQMEKSIKLLDSMISNDIDCIETLSDRKRPQEELDIHKSIMNISNKYTLNIEPNSSEYELAKKQYKYIFKNLYKDILTYNKQLTDYSMLNAPPEDIKRPVNSKHLKYTLESAIQSYLKEIQTNITPRSFKDQQDCLYYLIDFCGKDFPVNKVDAEMVLDIKEKLQSTPTGRNKGKETKGQSLLEQLAIAKEKGLPTLSATSVNKYLSYFSCLFDWAMRHKIIDENLFSGIAVKNNKKDNRRAMFEKDEVSIILKELKENKSNLIKNKSQYWGALIAVYTGARRNEICALTVGDVIHDKKSGIWYFNITDEEEGKSLKTTAAKRLVPIHSRLIELGFMEYLETAKKIVISKSKHQDMEARLLYDFTYTEHDKWGRKLGQFMNERLLKELNLHVKNKKTLHSLRHSFITCLDRANVKVENIKSMVGHEQGTVTHAIYTHYGIDYLPQFKEAIEKLPY